MLVSAIFRVVRVALVAVAAGPLAAVACGAPAQKEGQMQAPSTASEDQVAVKEAFDTDEIVAPATATLTEAQQEEARKAYSPCAARKYPKRPFFGDTHNHTMNSGDAFMAGDRLSPEQAYRFARGEEVVSSTGVPVMLSRPLDFLSTTYVVVNPPR